jgi:hypothetical protein
MITWRSLNSEQRGGNGIASLSGHNVMLGDNGSYTIRWSEGEPERAVLTIHVSVAGDVDDLKEFIAERVDSIIAENPSKRYENLSLSCWTCNTTVFPQNRTEERAFREAHKTGGTLGHQPAPKKTRKRS